MTIKGKKTIVRIDIPTWLYNVIHRESVRLFVTMGALCKIVLLTNLDYRSPSYFNDRDSKASVIGKEKKALGIYFTPNVLVDIDKAARASGATRSAWIRHCLIDKMGYKIEVKS